MGHPVLLEDESFIVGSKVTCICIVIAEQLQNLYALKMVVFRYKILNTLYQGGGGGDDDDDDNNNNNNNKKKKKKEKKKRSSCLLAY